MKRVSATNYLLLACYVWFCYITEGSKHVKQCILHCQSDDNAVRTFTLSAMFYHECENQCYSCADRSFGDFTDPVYGYSCMLHIMPRSFLNHIRHFLLRNFLFCLRHWYFHANVILDLSVVLQFNHNLFFVFFFSHAWVLCGSNDAVMEGNQNWQKLINTALVLVTSQAVSVLCSIWQMNLISSKNFVGTVPFYRVFTLRLPC